MAGFGHVIVRGRDIYWANLMYFALIWRRQTKSYLFLCGLMFCNNLDCLGLYTNGFRQDFWTKIYLERFHLHCCSVSLATIHLLQDQPYSCTRKRGDEYGAPTPTRCGAKCGGVIRTAKTKVGKREPSAKNEPKERIKDIKQERKKPGITPNKQLNGNWLPPQPPPVPFLPVPFLWRGDVRQVRKRRRRVGVTRGRARDRQSHAARSGDVEAELCAGSSGHGGGGGERGCCV